MTQEQKDRVLAERAELHERLTKLYAFQCSAKFQLLPAEDKMLLNHQAQTMADYEQILNERIERF